MKGSDVVTSDDEKVGQVVGEFGDYLIVETGTVFKARHAVPKTYATPREDGACCLTVPKNVVLDSPKVEFDVDAVAEHYGLASAHAAPPTEGYGDIDPDETAWGPDQDAAAAGLPTAEQRRAQVREHRRHERLPSSSPGLLGNRRNPDLQ